ncbi:rhamnogalacturonan acetylesterase [Catenovulum sediminis]|uniref:Rhamnogalacturonan acetylesterase n=1 Tax=Catenovulum sediminis TaxID=1740262 RepID=A0ABV1REC2_9ALTE
MRLCIICFRLLACIASALMSASLYASEIFDINFDNLSQPNNYTQQRGFGLDSFANSNEHAFSVKIPEGHYKIKLQVKGKQSSTEYLVFSEDRRVMTTTRQINKNEIQHLEFYVNVKYPNLTQAEHDADNQPSVRLRGDEHISRNWDEKLTISLSNRNVEFHRLQIEPTNTAKILLAGDSTVADQASHDYASWGQFLPAQITNRLVINHARSGETLKSFIFSLRWDKLLSQTQKDDIVLIQFAHNDEKKQWPRTYSAADGAYPAYLQAFIADVRQKGAFPILVSPVARRIYNTQNELLNTHAGYDRAVREVAEKTQVPIIDLTAHTTHLYQYLGHHQAAKAFAAGGQDKTHHNHYGAWLISNFVSQQLKLIYPENIQLSDRLFNLAQPPLPAEKIYSPSLWPDMRPVKVSISGS